MPFFLMCGLVLSIRHPQYRHQYIEKNKNVSSTSFFKAPLIPPSSSEPPPHIPTALRIALYPYPNTSAGDGHRTLTLGDTTTSKALQWVNNLDFVDVHKLLPKTSLQAGEEGHCGWKAGEEQFLSHDFCALCPLLVPFHWSSLEIWALGRNITLYFI